MQEDTTATVKRGTSSSSTVASSSANTTASTSRPPLTLSKAQKASLAAKNEMLEAARFAQKNNIPLESVVLFEDSQFSDLKKMRQQNAWEGKRNKDRDERLEKKEKLIHGVDSLSASDIEAFTVRKRENDKEDKIAKTIEMRASKQSFHAGKKKKSKLNATHTEHAKRGKLFTMTKRSRRVGAKLKLSHEDKNKRDKDNKSGAVKFRINRGWKA